MQTLTSPLFKKGLYKCVPVFWCVPAILIYLFGLHSNKQNYATLFQLHVMHIHLHFCPIPRLDVLVRKLVRCEYRFLHFPEYDKLTSTWMHLNQHEYKPLLLLVRWGL